MTAQWVDGPAPDIEKLPTFDEWFEAKHYGSTFNSLHEQPGTLIMDSMMALSIAIRCYVSEMQRISSKLRQ